MEDHGSQKNNPKSWGVKLSVRNTWISTSQIFFGLWEFIQPTPGTVCLFFNKNVLCQRTAQQLQNHIGWQPQVVAN
jgi:hypothetical protein